jgi:FkbM family methyltransferase
MKIVYKILHRIATRLIAWIDRRQLGKVDSEIFRYTDCLATVRTINKYHSAIRLCDIGANAGDWSYVMRQLNPHLEDVVMFEPQAELIAGLRTLELPDTVKHVYQCALGDCEDVLTLAGGTASASLFGVAHNQQRYFPGSTNQDCEQVVVKVLDDIYKTDGLAYPDIIKVDVQGYELNVLRGARNVLAHARYLVIELSLREFYLGQPPLWELWKFLDEEQYVMVDHGYELRSYSAPHELLQFDAIFINKRFDRP